MVLVIDANVLFSALMNPLALATRIITSRKAKIYIPRFCIVEIFKYKEKILRYSKVPEAEIYEALYSILEALHFVDDSEIADKHKLKALQLCDGVDLKDTVYVAAALALQATLWTGDRKLREGLEAKGFHQFSSTVELSRHLFGDQE